VISAIACLLLCVVFAVWRRATERTIEDLRAELKIASSGAWPQKVARAEAKVARAEAERDAVRIALAQQSAQIRALKAELASGTPQQSDRERLLERQLADALRELSQTQRAQEPSRLVTGF